MLLATKLHIPARRHDLVARPRLLHKLHAGLRSRLILLSSPPGFGKTTLLTQWLGEVMAQTEATPAVAWLALDDGDNDPVRFFTYLMAAVQQVCPSATTIHAPAPSADAFNHESMLTALINSVSASPGHKVLVLDDYHVIHAQMIHQAIAFFVEHIPETLHLAISTRADPPLPLARWRARRELCELREADLRFRAGEAQEFLTEIMGVPLSDHEVATLEQATEGWIAGLQLAALSMQDAEDLSYQVQRFAGTHVYIGDYLTEEVLLRQTPEIQQFLFDTSILRRFSAALCNAVTERSDAMAVLAALDRGHLFLIPLDGEHIWYRYHHLFAEMLYSRLAHAGPARVAMLHRRAAQWFLEQGSLAEAIDHALAADADFAATLIEEHRQEFQRRGEYVTLASWLRQVPDAIYAHHPRLCLLRARSSVFLHDLDEAEVWLARTQQVLAARPELDADAAILTSALNVQCDIALNRCELPRAAELAQEALALIPPARQRQRGEVLMLLGVVYFFSGDFGLAYTTAMEAAAITVAAGDRLLSVYARVNAARSLHYQGRLHAAAADLRAVEQEARRQGDAQQPLFAGWYFAMAELTCEWNQLDAAHESALTGLMLARQVGNPRTVLSCYTQILRVLWAQGRFAEAATIMEEVEALIRQVRLPQRMVETYTYVVVRLALACGNHDVVTAWLAHAPDPEEPPIPGAEALHLLLGRVLAARGAQPQALALVLRLQAIVAARDSGRLALEIELACAVLLAATGAQAEAERRLTDALGRAAPEGIVRMFVEEGEPMRALLLRSQPRLADAGLRDFVAKLLCAFPSPPPSVAAAVALPAPTAAKTDTITESLSARELEVLHLVNRGLSDRAVAEQLVVVTGTVKRHLSNIYDKLGVRSRTQALARARALGWLPPDD